MRSHSPFGNIFSSSMRFFHFGSFSYLNSSCLQWDCEEAEGQEGVPEGAEHLCANGAVCAARRGWFWSRWFLHRSQESCRGWYVAFHFVMCFPLLLFSLSWIQSDCYKRSPYSLHVFAVKLHLIHFFVCSQTPIAPACSRPVPFLLQAAARGDSQARVWARLRSRGVRQQVLAAVFQEEVHGAFSFR